MDDQQPDPSAHKLYVPVLRKIYVRVGTAIVELEGEQLSLASPAISDLIAKIIAAGTSPTTDAAQIVAATNAVTAEADRMQATIDAIPKQT